MQQIKFNPIPGLELNIDLDKLLHHLAEQSSPEDIAFVLFEKYGPTPLTSALNTGFQMLQLRLEQAKAAKEIVDILYPVTSTEPPEMPLELVEPAKPLALDLLAEQVIATRDKLDKPERPPKEPVVYYPRQCKNLNCNKTFTPNSPDQKYCQTSCGVACRVERHKAEAEERRKKRLEEIKEKREKTNQENKEKYNLGSKHCAWEECGALFYPASVLQKYCTRKCSKSAWDRAHYHKYFVYQNNQKNKETSKEAENLQPESSATTVSTTPPNAIIDLYAERNCEYPACNKLFVPRVLTQMYCQRICATTYRLEKSRQATRERNNKRAQERLDPKNLKVCDREGCNISFIPNSYAQRFCGDRCRRLDWESQNPDKIENYNQIRSENRRTENKQKVITSFSEPSSSLEAERLP